MAQVRQRRFRHDEHLLIVHDQELVQAYADDFARLRSAIGPSTFACNAAASPTNGDTNGYAHGDGYEYSNGYTSKPNNQSRHHGYDCTYVVPANHQQR